MVESQASRLALKVLVLSLTSLASETQSFILGDQGCFNTCTCYYRGNSFQIHCMQRNLTSFPSFYLNNAPPATQNEDISIDLRENSLTSVPFHAFGNLTTRPGKSWDISLSKNRISRVNNGAFTGLEKKRLRLSLSDNLLTSLPPALSDLDLERLDVSSNPITVFDPFVLYFSAGSIAYFQVSLSLLGSWPAAFKTVNAARWYIDGFNGTTIPSGGLKSTWSPTEVTISNTKLVDISNILCDVENLGGLYLYDNIFLNADVSLDVCKNSTSPEKLKSISIVGSGLTHVPVKLNSFRQLGSVTLNRNNITTITDTDFKELTLLSVLYLSENPITSISAQAFTRNTQLRSLYISASLLDFPDFLFHMKGIHSLHWITIPCDCNTLRAFQQANTTLSDDMKSQIGCSKHPSYNLLKVMKELLPICP